MIHRWRGAAALLVPLLAAAGCSSSESPGTGQVTVLLTDSPLASVQSAMVWVSKVYLIGGTDPAGPQYTITTTPASYDLLSLQGGVTAALGTATIPTGTYSQMRLVVDSAYIKLAGGVTFPSGSDSAMLTVPSGMQTGIKVTFAAPVQITPGQTILVADFSVAQSFVLTGPAGAPTGALFNPVIHATAENVAGSIAGTVTPASAEAAVYAIFNATGDTLGRDSADVSTGAYKIWFLPPGAYTVSAKGNGLSVSKTVTLNPAQDMTGVDFP
jgi:hypothetical protein